IVSAVENFKSDDGNTYTKVDFEEATDFSNYTLTKRLSTYVPTTSAKLWTRHENLTAAQQAQITALDGYSTPSNRIVLNLDSQYSNIEKGEFVILNVDGDYHFGKVRYVRAVDVEPDPDVDISINGSTFSMPRQKIPITRVGLYRYTDGGDLYDLLDAETVDSENITLHFGLQKAGPIVNEGNPTLKSSNDLNLVTEVESPLGTYEATDFQLEDVNGVGVALHGELSDGQDELEVSDRSGWEDELYAPVNAYGNILTASRGETVTGEVLGNGDASQASQQFMLKKSPLTYLLSPTADNDSGVMSTLRIWVDGIEWAEVSTFYGMEEEDEVFIVRQNDEGESIITFGDGIRGRRLPSGTRTPPRSRGPRRSPDAASPRSSWDPASERHSLPIGPAPPTRWCEGRPDAG
ncbi:MAG: hypothetical protein AAF570_26495, partial [Bacteroidota bacterium]